MAYTNDFTTRSGNYNVGSKILDQEVTLSRYFDCTVDALGSAEYSKLFSVPAGFQVNEVYATCVATETSDTFDIVDDDSATTTLLSNADMSAVGKVTATNARKYYASAGFICIKPDAALTTAKFYLTVKGIQLNTKM